MTLARRIIDLIHSGAVVQKCMTEPMQGHRMIYYVIECSGVHIAIWRNWTIVNGEQAKRRFYLTGNPAYRYIESYKFEMDVMRNDIRRRNRRRRQPVD